MIPWEITLGVALFVVARDVLIVVYLVRRNLEKREREAEVADGLKYLEIELEKLCSGARVSAANDLGVEQSPVVKLLLKQEGLGAAYLTPEVERLIEEAFAGANSR